MTWSLPEPMLTAAADPDLPPGWAAESDRGEVVEQAPQLCRRLNVGQVTLARKFMDSGMRDVLPHEVERRSVGGRSAITLADDQVDLLRLLCHHIRRRC